MALWIDVNAFPVLNRTWSKVLLNSSISSEEVPGFPSIWDIRRDRAFVEVGVFNILLIFKANGLLAAALTFAAPCFALLINENPRLGFLKLGIKPRAAVMLSDPLELSP